MDKESRREGAGPVVVALGPGVEGAALVAQGAAVAERIGRGLACITVDDGGTLSPEAASRLAASHELARAEGAAIARASGIDKPEAIRQFAEEQGAQALIVGCRPGSLSRKTTAARLIAARRSFEVVALSPPSGEAQRKRNSPPFPMSGSSVHYAIALLIVVLATATNLALASYAGYWAAAIIYLAAISIGAIWLEPGPTLLAAILTVFAWDFLFIPPRFTLSVSRPEDALMLALYLLVSISSGLMTSRLRSGERLLRSQQEKLSRINALAIALVGAPSASAMIDRGITSIEGALDCEAIVILKEGHSLAREAESGWEPLDATAREAAQRCFEDGAVSGTHTAVLPSSEWHFAALEAPKERIGVLGVRTAHDSDWDDSMEAYLQTLTSTLAMALARTM